MYIRNFTTQKGYILYDLQTHNISISRDVIFHEHIFPLKHSNTPSNIHTEDNTPSNDNVIFDDENHLQTLTYDQNIPQ